MVCKHLNDEMNNELIWKYIINNLRTTRVFKNNILPKKFNSWKEVFFNRAHVRSHGIYCGIESYIREKVEDSSQYRYTVLEKEGNINNFRFEKAKNYVCHYYRYFRFLPNGKCQYYLGSINNSKHMGNVFLVHEPYIQYISGSQMKFIYMPRAEVGRIFFCFNFFLV